MECEFLRLVLDMTRSRVLPAIWVGEWMCWVRLFDDSIMFRPLELLDSMFMGILRSTKRNSGIELWGGRYVTMMVNGFEQGG